jgi:hypothetical protein
MKGETSEAVQPLLDVLAAQSTANLAICRIISDLLLGRHPAQQAVNDLFDCVAAVNDATGVLIELAKAPLPGPKFGSD